MFEAEAEALKKEDKSTKVKLEFDPIADVNALLKNMRTHAKDHAKDAKRGGTKLLAAWQATVKKAAEDTSKSSNGLKLLQANLAKNSHIFTAKPSKEMADDFWKNHAKIEHFKKRKKQLSFKSLRREGQQSLQAREATPFVQQINVVDGDGNYVIKYSYDGAGLAAPARATAEAFIATALDQITTTNAKIIFEKVIEDQNPQMKLKQNNDGRGAAWADGTIDMNFASPRTSAARVIHEAMHVLGFAHTNQRSDWGKCRKGSPTHYIYPEDEADNCEVLDTAIWGKYDADSIMHYPGPHIANGAYCGKIEKCDAWDDGDCRGNGDDMGKHFYDPGTLSAGDVLQLLHYFPAIPPV